MVRQEDCQFSYILFNFFFVLHTHCQYFNPCLFSGGCQPFPCYKDWLMKAESRDQVLQCYFSHGALFLESEASDDCHNIGNWHCLILLLVCESNEGPIKASSLLFIKEKDKTSIPPHLIGKKDFSTRAFEGFLTLVKESRLPGHGVQFLVPSLSYDPCEDRSKTKIFSDRIVVESRFNILLSAEWLVIDFHKCKVLWLPLKFWEQNINFYMPMFQFSQMAYNVFIA